MRFENKRVVELLNDENLKIKDLAKFMQLDPSVIHTWRRGETYPSTENMIKLSLFFDCSLDYLFYRTEEIGNGSNKFLSSFSERLRLLMKDKKKSTYQITRKDKLFSSSCFTRWFVEGTLPNPEMLVKLADYFTVTIEYLLGRE